MLAIMDKSTEGGLKSIRNTMSVRQNLPEHREYLPKFPRNLKFLYATGPRSSISEGLTGVVSVPFFPTNFPLFSLFP